MYKIIKSLSYLIRYVLTYLVFKNLSIYNSFLLNDWVESLIVTILLYRVSYAIVGRIGIDDSYINIFLYFVIYLIILFVLWIILSILTFFKILPIA